MGAEPIDLFLDTNDADWTSQRYYVDMLAEQYRTDSRVRLVESIDEAEVVHVNSLNPLGRVIHGKEDKWQHLGDVATVMRGLDVPVVMTEHGVEEFSDLESSMFVDSTAAVNTLADATKRQLERLFASQADAIIAISSMDRQYLLRAGFDPERVFHVPHGVGDEFFQSGDSTDGEYILHVSKCSPHKNPEAIMETASRMDVPVKIAGGGWEENHGEELSEIDNVEVLGYVSKSRLLDLYRSATVFYFPSTYEPFGLPILEAMASGAAVVASKNSAGPDLCAESISLVDPDDVDQHVEAISELLADDQLRRSRGQAARERAETFTWSATADATIGVYEQVAVT